MIVRLKGATSLDRVHHEVFRAIAAAATVWAKHGADELWITGANEPGHSTGPRGFHRLPDGTCQAVDLRTWNIADHEARHEAATELAAELGPMFDVLYEEEVRDPTTGTVLRGEHVHVQHDPERPGTVRA